MYVQILIYYAYVHTYCSEIMLVAEKRHYYSSILGARLFLVHWCPQHFSLVEVPGD